MLLLRVERIGDLLMVMDAIAAARAAWPAAQIDLAVGRLERSACGTHPGDRPRRPDRRPVAGARRHRVVLEGPARTRKGLARALHDPVVNFEPDIRTNLLA